MTQLHETTTAALGCLLLTSSQEESKHPGVLGTTAGDVQLNDTRSKGLLYGQLCSDGSYPLNPLNNPTWQLPPASAFSAEKTETQPVSIT